MKMRCEGCVAKSDRWTEGWMQTGTSVKYSQIYPKKKIVIASWCRACYHSGAYLKEAKTAAEAIRILCELEAKETR